MQLKASAHILLTNCFLLFAQRKRGLKKCRYNIHIYTLILSVSAPPRESLMIYICSSESFSPLYYPINTQFALGFISICPHSLWAVTKSCISFTLHLQVRTVWAWTNSCMEHWHLMDRLKWLFWLEFDIMRQLWRVAEVSLAMLWLPLPGSISTLEI